MNPITTPLPMRAGVVPSWDLLQIHRTALKHGWQFEDYSAALRWTEIHRPDDPMIKVWRWLASVKRGQMR